MNRYIVSTVLFCALLGGFFYWYMHHTIIIIPRTFSSQISEGVQRSTTLYFWIKDHEEQMQYTCYDTGEQQGFLTHVVQQWTREYSIKNKNTVHPELVVISPYQDVIISFDSSFFTAGASTVQHMHELEVLKKTVSAAVSQARRLYILVQGKVPQDTYLDLSAPIDL